MKDLQVGSNGDLIISKHDLQLVNDKELTLQKVKLVLSTNKGEIDFEEEEGINFRAFLTKNPNQDEMLDTVRDGLHQVDETFVITEYSFETKQRHLILTFKAVNDSGEEVSLAVGNVQINQGGKIITVLVCAEDSDKVLSSGNAITATCICDTDSKIINCCV